MNESSLQTFIRLQNLHIVQQISKQLESRGFSDRNLCESIMKICQLAESQEQFVTKATQEMGSTISQHFLSSLYNMIRQKMIKKQTLMNNLQNLQNQQTFMNDQQSGSKSSSYHQPEKASHQPLEKLNQKLENAKQKSFPGLCLPNKDQIDLDLDMGEGNQGPSVHKKEQEQTVKRQSKIPENKKEHFEVKRQKLPQIYDDKRKKHQQRSPSHSQDRKKHKKDKKKRSYSQSRSRSRDRTRHKKKERKRSPSEDRQQKKKERRHEKRSEQRDKYKPRQPERRVRAKQEQEQQQIQAGKIYRGMVTRVEKIGCFVKLLNVNKQTTGLVHASQIRQEETPNVHDIIKEGQRVFVKIVQILTERVRLSMKEVNQRTGKEFAKPTQETAQLVMEEQPKVRKHYQRGTGELTGITMDENEANAQTGQQQASSYAELWEINRLRYMGGLVKNNPIVGDDIQQVNIEMNNRQPPFLTGQTTKAGIKLSPVRVVKNPQGTLQREALNAVQYARERRQVREQQTKQQTRNLASILDEVTPGQGGRNKIKASFTSQPKNAKMSIQQQRNSLPIFLYKEHLVKACCDNKVLIVIGQTGSGKTTQMTQYLYEHGFAKRGKIGCTQPRRVAAMSVAKRVCEEMGVKLGDEVGYSIRFEDCTSNKTVIKYMTDGMLLRQALIDKFLSQYSVIMLDEAHERTIHTDVLFGILKKVIQKRNDLTLIVTSATLEAKKFSSYFYDCKIFSIPGRTYNVEIFYSKEPQTDYLDAALMCIMQIHMDEPPGDILLFLTGQQEIDTACQVLNDRIKKLGANAPELLSLPVYSALPSQLQTRIFEPAPKGKRKCVIATNIAEASLTIDGIYYVVDPGFAKIKIYNSKLGMDTLIVAPISQASAKQRAGRAGRTGPGKCYRLYTQQAYQREMLPTSVPQIQRANLSNTVLELKAMGINDLINFGFMDPPPVQTLIAALQQLYYLSALDDEGLLTKLGRKMAEFPLEPSLSKMLLTSIDLGCSEEIVTIISMLSVQNVFYRPKQKETVADQKKTKFNHYQGDHLTYLSVFESWKNQGYSTQWCHENYIQFRSLKRAQDVKKQIDELLQRYKFKMASCRGNFTIIRKTIVSGFFFNAAKKDPKGGYRTLVDDHQVYIHPSSSLFNKEPEWVVYHELIFTTKQYMRDVCAIDPKWLIDVAPNFFKFTDQIGFTRKKRNQRLDPLNQKHGDNNAWRLSKRKG